MADDKRSYLHMVPLEQRERQVGFAAAALALTLTLVFSIPHLGQLTSHAPAHRAAGQYSVATGLIVGLTSAAVLAWSSFRRVRLLLGISALFTGEFNPWGSIPLLYGLPFLVLAGWQLVRWSRFAGLRIDARRAQAGQEDDGGKDRGRGASSTASGRSGSSRGRTHERRSRRGEPPAIQRPSASKRYTPPKC